MLSKPWGDATVTNYSSSPATNRVLRVGIDYTYFVTEDGTSVVSADGTPVAKKYGLQPQETFAGYEYVTTRTEANGDRVHVYKKVTVTPVAPTPATPTPTTPATPAPEAPATPKTGDTNLFTAFAMLVSGMIAGAAAFITKKKNA